MNAATIKPDPNAPPHFTCVECGHQKGEHTRSDRSMGRCWHRPVKGNKERPDFSQPACTCKEFR